ncbi:MAG: energy-coupling factor transporter transmembrane component T [Ktedonobacteraceae bacterium]
MIELTRDITFGQYINKSTALTKMDPRTKLVCAILLIVFISIVSSFIAFTAFLLFCMLVQWVSRLPVLYVLRGFRPFVPFIIFFFFVTVLFYTPPAHTPILWQWGILSVSWSGIIGALLGMVRLFFLYYITSMLTFTTSLVDLTSGLQALLAPLQRIGVPVNAFIMVLVIAFKFVPIFIVEIERLVKAQTARGVRFDEGNVIQRILKLAPLFVPLFVNGFKRAQVLSVAMDARCFGSRPGWRRSTLRELTFERSDALVLLATGVICVGMLALNIFIML